jgi:cytoskeletal protein CcmA (bactofilin family)
MTVEKKTIRSDIPGSHVFLNGNIGYVGSTAEETSRLVVARDITLAGQIGACNYLVIEGVVQAETFAARRMDILESGLFSGAADVQECVIAGRFEGKLAVAGRLTVKPTGQVFGEITYGVLEVEAGARIEGNLVAVPVVVEAPVAPPAPQDNVEKLFPAAPEPEPVSERTTAYRRAARA